ncbi:Sec-independent protein translocase protein TatB [Luteimonas kalidii]|uniref:Sec-independent protein translocase protein TatB n=1 Tax=Luteimonas kalidii TaxID=3042025 RepID=A0ABT6JX11_9GAMM|nr:Sec-independent protein translocase protein TatB [Luteimonas kalidii]MDH5835033.1 Sec-independent protein translocase protein TatB [Luteimonas kalidii]
MFDIGFTELLLIAVVALVVLGPERLPKAARFAGLWVRRARAQWFSVKSELERELAAEELKRSLHDAKQAASRLQDTMRETEDEVQAKVRAAEAEARREIESMRRQASGAPGATAAAPSLPAAAQEEAATRARRFDAPPATDPPPLAHEDATDAGEAPAPADASTGAEDAPLRETPAPAEPPRQAGLPGFAHDTDPDDGRGR